MDIHEISPQKGYEAVLQGAVLVDIRSLDERVSGQAAGALCVDRQVLEQEPGRWLPSKQARVVLICQSGVRSRRSGGVLQGLGYEDVMSVSGGTSAWIAAGLPVVVPELSANEAGLLGRYSRQLRLPEVGLEGQKKLQGARVLMVGAGGLGSPVSFYLAAAGVGHLRVVDDDVVDVSNLHRQILHTTERVGEAKVDSASATLSALNPSVEIEAIRGRVDVSNIDALMDGVDVVVDGSDNFPVRYLLNDACIKYAKPLVYGAVQQFDGQVSVFDAGRHRGELPCYRCLFPEPPLPEFAPSCAEAGVLGVVPGVVGLLQATEAIKLVLGIGEGLAGRMLLFDALGMQFREINVPADRQCALCAPGQEFSGYIDYANFCS